MKKYNIIIFERHESNAAITLIALIITIIVLLILAGVTLNMVMGENGLFGKANNAKNKTERNKWNNLNKKKKFAIKLANANRGCKLCKRKSRIYGRSKYIWGL